jgi:hypothetical protein
LPGRKINEDAVPQLCPLALRAADEVRLFRSKFGSLAAISRELTPNTDATGWPVYHAAVASGLVGDYATAERLFKRLMQKPPTAAWHEKLQLAGAELAQTLSDGDEFRQTVLAIIQKSRALRHLPPDPTCLDAA